MQRYGKRQLKLFLRKQADLVHKAAGRQADVPHSDVQPVRAVDQLQKAHHIVKIVKRLANAHQNDVGDLMPESFCAKIT